MGPAVSAERIYMRQIGVYWGPYPLDLALRTSHSSNLTIIMVGVTAGTKAPVSLVGVRNNTHRNWWSDNGLRRLNLYIAL